MEAGRRERDDGSAAARQHIIGKTRTSSAMAGRRAESGGAFGRGGRAGRPPGRLRLVGLRAVSSPWKAPSRGNAAAVAGRIASARSGRSDSPRTWKTLARFPLFPPAHLEPGQPIPGSQNQRSFQSLRPTHGIPLLGFEAGFSEGLCWDGRGRLPRWERASGSSDRHDRLCGCGGFRRRPTLNFWRPESRGDESLIGARTESGNPGTPFLPAAAWMKLSSELCTNERHVTRHPGNSKGALAALRVECAHAPNRS